MGNHSCEHLRNSATLLLYNSFDFQIRVIVHSLQGCVSSISMYARYDDKLAKNKAGILPMFLIHAQAA